MLFEKLRGTTPRLLDASTLIGDDLPRSGKLLPDFQKIWDHDFYFLGDGAGESVANEQKDRRFSAHLHNFTELCLRPSPAER